jgi:hypothetical protein
MWKTRNACSAGETCSETPTWKTEEEMALREIGYEDGRWMQLAQYQVQRRSLILAVLKNQIHLPDSSLNRSKILETEFMEHL